MAYFVTGGTGFIGRFLLERLLQRDGQIHALCRDGSRGRLQALADRLGAGDRILPVIGDLSQPLLGIDEEWLETHAGTIDRFFHLAAIYDMTADDETNLLLNVGGTKQAVAVANALRAGCLHHVSSVAAAGLYEGIFTEAMFDEGQPLEHPYHRTKFEGERIVRTEAEGAWRIYRPAIVVGHSQTGEMDKVDGPYYLFRALKLGARLPELVPLFGPKLGDTNIVPVDYVVDAIDHISHQPGLDGQAFHLVNPEPQSSTEMINVFAKAAGAPRIREKLPAMTFDLAMKVPGLKTAVLPRIGIPAEVVDYVGFTCRFDDRKAEAALRGSGITVPPLESYAQRLWDYWATHLDRD